jgi:hypothetical protein
MGVQLLEMVEKALPENFLKNFEDKLLEIVLLLKNGWGGE